MRLKPRETFRNRITIRNVSCRTGANIHCASSSLMPLVVPPNDASGMTCRSGPGPTEISPVNGRSCAVISNTDVADTGCKEADRNASGDPIIAVDHGDRE